MIGVVEAVGADVRTVKRGDVLVMPFAFSDDTCMFRDEGRYGGHFQLRHAPAKWSLLGAQFGLEFAGKSIGSVVETNPRERRTKQHAAKALPRRRRWGWAPRLLPVKF